MAHHIGLLHQEEEKLYDTNHVSETHGHHPAVFQLLQNPSDAGNCRRLPGKKGDFLLWYARQRFLTMQGDFPDRESCLAAGRRILIRAHTFTWRLALIIHDKMKLR